VTGTDGDAGPAPSWTVRDGIRSNEPGAGADVATSQVRGAALEGADQSATRVEVLDFLASQPAPLERTNTTGHLTGSALVIDPRTLQVVVLFHHKLRRWLQPGGHADGDGDLARVAWREATEETGIVGLRVVEPAVHLDIHEVLPPREPPHLHLDVRFVVLAPPGAPLQGNHESDDLRWVDAEELPGLGADPGLVMLAARAVSVLRALPPGVA